MIFCIRDCLVTQQLSQFWYDDRTSQALASEVLRLVGETGSVACISCPTLYKQLRKVKPAGVTSI